MPSPIAAVPTAESAARTGSAERSSFDPARFSRLSEAQILEQIGELLARALIRSGHLSRSAQRGAAVEAKAASATLDPVAMIRDPVVRQIAGFLKIAGHANPGEIGFALGLKRRTLTRKLHLLRRTGLCVVTGKTRTARYELRVDFARN